MREDGQTIPPTDRDLASPIDHHRRQLGAGDREPTFGLGPEATEIGDKRLPT
jgi:hypothetical protein